MHTVFNHLRSSTVPPTYLAYGSCCSDQCHNWDCCVGFGGGIDRKPCPQSPQSMVLSGDGRREMLGDCLVSGNTFHITCGEVMEIEGVGGWDETVSSTVALVNSG